MVPSIRDRERDWGGEQGRGGGWKNTYWKQDEESRVGWEVWDRERELHPSSIFLQVFLPSVIFHLQTFLLQESREVGYFPAQCHRSAWLRALTVALCTHCQCQSSLPQPPGCPRSGRLMPWLPWVLSDHYWGAGPGAWGLWVIPWGFPSTEALLTVVSNAFCSQLQVIIGLMVPLPCCAAPLFCRMLSDVVPNSPWVSTRMGGQLEACPQVCC